MNASMPHLELMDGYPEGDATAWLERYAPLIDQVHRFVEHPAPRVSLVMVGWRREGEIVEALDHALNQRGLSRDELELILVDNGGLQNVHVDIAARVSTHVVMAGNAGVSIARNIGAALSHGPIIFFIEDDGLIAQDYCINGLRHFEDPHVMGLRARVVAKAHPYLTTLASHYDRGTTPVDELLITEGASAIRREVYMKIGGFAERLFGHEGIELSFRVKQHFPHALMLYVPDMVMAHDYMDGLPKFIKKNFRYNNMDNSVAARDPELAQFMEDYFSTRFGHRPRTLDERAARVALMGARKVLRLAAQLKSK